MQRLLIVLFVLGALMASCGGGGEKQDSTDTVLILEPERGVQRADLDAAVDGAVLVIQRRIEAFKVDGEVRRVSDCRVEIRARGINVADLVERIGRTAILQFCEPIIDTTGNIAITRDGIVTYRPQTCDPVRDNQGNIVVTGGIQEFAAWDPSVQSYSTDDIIWQPATGDIDGRQVALTGEFLRPTTYVTRDQLGINAILAFELTGDGPETMGQVTERLATRNYPFAPFLDGQPIRGEDGVIIAPAVQQQITRTGVIYGLGENDAEFLSTLLNTGSFPVPLIVVDSEEGNR